MASYTVETILRIRDNATRQLLKYSGTLRDLEKQIEALNASMSVLQKGLEASAEASTTAASGARAAAAGYNATARAATRAAAAIARYNVAAGARR